MSGCCGQGPVLVSGAAATSRVDVETVLLCDVLPDGTVAGVVLVEPIYDTSSGARVGTRTVNPVTGATYTPQGTLCPCSTDGCNATTATQILCDVAADGTATQFVSATTYDCQGAVLATLDRTLAGAAYTATGTVGVCPAAPDCESPTTPTATVGLCLANGTPIAVTVVRDCEGVVTSEGWINLTTGAWSAGAVPAGTVACGESRSIQVSGTFCDVDAGGDVVGLVLVEYTYDDTGAISAVRLVDAVTGGTYTPTGAVTVCPAGVEQPERDILELCDTAADGTVTAFVRDYARDENGAIVGHSDYALDGAAYTPAGTVGNCEPGPQPEQDLVQLCDTAADGTATPFVRDFRRDNNGAIVGFSDYTLAGAAYTPSGTVGVCDASAEEIDHLQQVLCDTAADGTVTQFLRHWTVDNTTGALTAATDTALDGTTAYTPTGNVGACQSCTRQVVERCGCDDTDGDGLGDVRYTELWAVDPCGGAAPELLGTYLDGDLTQPYTPTAPVECTAADALPGPLNTGVRAVTGIAAQDFAGTFPGLQSISLTVLSGNVLTTMSDGSAVPIPAGVTMTWSVAQDSDTALAVASFAGATAAASYLLNWTYR